MVHIAWSTPKTFAVGDVLTASDMNTYQRDNLSAVLPNGTSWQSYSPQLTAFTTNPTLGSGSVQSGSYTRIGDLVTVQIEVRFGTSGASAGSGNYFVSLPVSPGSTGDYTVGQGQLYDSSATSHTPVVARRTGSVVYMTYDGGDKVTHAVPFAWAVSDRISLLVTYEAA